MDNISKLLSKYNTYDRIEIEKKLKDLDKKNIELYKKIFPSKKIPLYFSKLDNENLNSFRSKTSWEDYFNMLDESKLEELDSNTVDNLIQYNDNFCRTLDGGKTYKYPIMQPTGEIVLDTCDDIITDDIKNKLNLNKLIIILLNKSKLNILGNDVNNKNMTLNSDKLVKLLNEYNKLDNEYYQLLLLVKNTNQIMNERESLIDDKNNQIEEKKNEFNIKKDEVNEFIQNKKKNLIKNKFYIYTSKVILVILWFIIIINFLLLNINRIL